MFSCNVVSRWVPLVSVVAKAFSLTSFEVKIRLLGFLSFSNREKERDFLDLPLVADVEPLIESDFVARELTGTNFDFLHAGLAWSDGTRVCLLFLSGVYLPWMYLQF